MLENYRNFRAHPNSRKNMALKQVDQMLSTNKNELDKYRAAKMTKINQLKGKLDESQTAYQSQKTELENEREANELLSRRSNELEARVAELEREILRISDENEVFRSEIETTNSEKKTLAENMAKTHAENTEKFTSMKKILETERGKVAKYEQGESTEKSRAEKLQQSCDMLKLQLEQARVMRENLQKQQHSDRTNWQKKLSELGDELKQANDQVKSKDSEVSAIKSESNILKTNIETLNRELSTSKVCSPLFSTLTIFSLKWSYSRVDFQTKKTS